MAEERFTSRQFAVPGGSPLKAEHEAVKRWVADALAKLGKSACYEDLDPKTLPSGQVLLEGNAQQSRRYLMAAVEQIRHWDSEADRLGEVTEHPSVHSQWATLWGSRRQIQGVITALMRRSLPLEKEDLLQILGWVAGRELNSTGVLAPLVTISRALERFAKKQPFDAELSKAAQTFVAILRSCPDKRARVMGTTVEQLCVAKSA